MLSLGLAQASRPTHSMSFSLFLEGFVVHDGFKTGLFGCIAAGTLHGSRLCYLRAFSAITDCLAHGYASFGMPSTTSSKITSDLRVTACVATKNELKKSALAFRTVRLQSTCSPNGAPSATLSRSGSASRRCVCSGHGAQPLNCQDRNAERQRECFHL